jgi:hypothetical protein
LKSSSRKNRRLLVIFAAGVCLAAGSLLAADSSVPSRTKKPAPHVTSTRSSTHHAVAKSTVAHHPVSHSATTASRSAHHTPVKTSAHASTAAASGKAPVHSHVYASQRKGSTGHSHYTSHSRTRTLTARQGWSHVHLAPERVQEIQQALIRDGYLHSEPTGEWDSSTREAMLRYQTIHGFPPTGLPEAKALMKLGLGPHPLPAELDHGEVAVSSAGVTGTVQSVFSVSPDSPAVSPSIPPGANNAPPVNK